MAVADDDTFDITGTMLGKHGDEETWGVLMDSVGGKTRPITINMSRLSGRFDRHKVGEPVTITVKGPNATRTSVSG